MFARLLLVLCTLGAAVLAVLFAIEVTVGL